MCKESAPKPAKKPKSTPPPKNNTLISFPRKYPPHADDKSKSIPRATILNKMTDSQAHVFMSVAELASDMDQFNDLRRLDFENWTDFRANMPKLSEDAVREVQELRKNIEAEPEKQWLKASLSEVLQCVSPSRCVTMCCLAFALDGGPVH